MEDTQSVAALVNSTASKIRQLQKAFADLESHRAITLNWKWKQLEEHFQGLEGSLKRRFTELEDQERDFEMKIVKAKEMLEMREAAVKDKEHDTLVKLQEKRDAAVSAITTTLEKHKNLFPDESAVNITEAHDEPEIFKDKVTNIIPSEVSISKIMKPCADVNIELKSNPELVKLCREMDSEGLHKFISDNRKNLASIKEELPIALGAATSPALLVLDSLQGFYSAETPSHDTKKDSNLLGLRRTCIMLMECLSMFLSGLDQDSISSIVTENVKERAKCIAEEWKPKLDELDLDASIGNSLEAHAFLQLLATFGINSDFNQQNLSKLIPMVSRRRQTADLCRYLGLSDKIPGVIDILMKNGRHIDAVNLVFSFELTDQFPPVSILKSYLTESTKVSSPGKVGTASSHGQNDASDKELTAIKGVIKCIEDHKLEQQYPLDPLHRRVHSLEKAKADKKRATEVAKPQSKRPRGNGVGCGGGARVVNVVSEKSFYPMVTERYNNNINNQFMYGGRPYCYPAPPPTENHVVPIATYNISHAPHGNFFGNGYQYPAAPYLH